MFNKIDVQAKEEVSIPYSIRQICDKYGEEYNVCSELLQAICWKESRCKVDVVSDDGNCIGLTQINPKSFKKEIETLGITDLTDADQNIHLCAYVITEYFEEEDEIYEVLMQWNFGYNKGKELFQKGFISSYAKSISEITAELERKHFK